MPTTSDSPGPLPLSIPVLGQREREYVLDCIDNGWVTSGDYIGRFEDAACALTGAKHAIACASGTAAIHVALRLAGVKQGDAVLVPALTFIATVNPVAYLGAHPVFMDCDEYMNIDVEKVDTFLRAECDRTADGTIDRVTGCRIAAILPVHVFGNPCRMHELQIIAEEWGIPIVEDAAESLGAAWTTGPLAGRHTGTVGTLGALSFNGNKIITTGGGGMILTSDDSLAEHAHHLVTQAKADEVRYVHDEVGYNYRLSNVAAAMGVAQMESLDARIAAKAANHMRYTELLADIEGIHLLGVPEGTAPNYWFYSAIIDRDVFGIDRETLMTSLAAQGIQTRPVWYLNHQQSPYSHERAYLIERAVWFWERVLNLPCTHTLEEDEIARVCDAIGDSRTR